MHLEFHIMFHYSGQWPLLWDLFILITVTVGHCSSAVHTGNPGREKSKKIISLNIAILMSEMTDLVWTRLSMEGSIIKN